MKKDKLLDIFFSKEEIDCSRLYSYLEEKFSRWNIKSEEDFFSLSRSVKEKVEEDFGCPFCMSNIDEVVVCMKSFIINKSKKFLKKEGY